MTHYDIAIVGAGMAGASLAAEMAGDASVILLEAEDAPGYHATGRSAAFWTESYGGPQVQPLTTASGPYLRQHGFLHGRAALTLGREDQREQVEQFVQRFSQAGVTMRLVGRGELKARIPGLRAGWTCGALEPDCCDIDVAALHQHYLAKARGRGAELMVRAQVERAARVGEEWRIVLANGKVIEASVLVNAAGAWADPVAEAAGVASLGMTPFRRTVAQLRVDPTAPQDLPLCLSIAGDFYFKPEAGRLWLSPHDEIPSQPCDAAPEEIDVALAIDRFEQVADWRIEAVERKWAGLRTFSPDRLPVYGFDPEQRGFFWFVGQGGFGIQTAPAAAALAGRLLRGNAPGKVDPAPYDPARFR